MRHEAFRPHFWLGFIDEVGRRELVVSDRICVSASDLLILAFEFRSPLARSGTPRLYSSASSSAADQRTHHGYTNAASKTLS